MLLAEELVLEGELGSDGCVHGFGDTDAARFRQALQARRNVDAVAIDVPPVLDDVAESDDSDFSGKLNVTWRIDDDRLVYATYSEGFRVGGSNPLKPASVLPRSYEPDEVRNYELGTKTEVKNMNSFAASR